jgi:plasmid stabilization system protein ParE
MRVVYTRHAIDDIENIFRFISSRAKQDVARGIVGRIVRTIEKQLPLFRRSGRIGAVPDTYKLVTSGPPYIVVYGLSDTQIIVYGVFHGAESR